MPLVSGYIHTLECLSTRDGKSSESSYRAVAPVNKVDCFIIRWIIWMIVGDLNVLESVSISVHWHSRL